MNNKKKKNKAVTILHTLQPRTTQKKKKNKKGKNVCPVMTKYKNNKGV